MLLTQINRVTLIISCRCLTRFAPFFLIFVSNVMVLEESKFVIRLSFKYKTEQNNYSWHLSQ